MTKTVMTVFGTRPELIKLAPVIQELEATPEIRSIVVCSGQHRELLTPLIQLFNVRIDHNLEVMSPGQSSNELCSKILSRLDAILESVPADLMLVQGDTSTALMGALTAFHRQIPIGHVEAGLRTDNPLSPYPEEMNRRLITRMARWHFAATQRNREALLREGVEDRAIVVTGNPVVDALLSILNHESPSPELQSLLEETSGLKRLVLTTHRRESFGGTLEQNLTEIRDFVRCHSDVVLLFPVHPNPMVRETASSVLKGVERIRLLEPMEYCDFLHLLANAWLIASDSGGIQEEAPTLGVPLLVLRDNTERPEAIEHGCAVLVGSEPGSLRRHLEEAITSPVHAASIDNPFGRGDSRKKIVTAITAE